MHTGMLWHDSSQTSLALKIRKAADYYQKKYGCRPKLVLVNPGLMVENEQSIAMEGLTIRPYQSVPPAHLWIGIEDMPTSAPKDEPT
jgi:hypothetical protein